MICTALLAVAGAGCTVQAADPPPSPVSAPTPQRSVTVPGCPGRSPTQGPGRRHRPAPWERRVEALARRTGMSVAVGYGDALVFAHRGRTPRVPASNEKLLLSMALLDRLGPSYRIPTRAAAKKVRGGRVEGDLWVIGRGDPTLTARQPGYWGGGLKATTLAKLAATIKRAGIRTVEGRVVGARGFFARDFDAPGWQPYVAGRYVQLPSALVLSGNNAGPPNPERAVAAALTRELRRIGVSVRGRAASGRPPANLAALATVRSRPLAEVVSYMNHTSNNFFAETLGKLLGAVTFGPPGTIAKGARAIKRWLSAHGVRARVHDSSGLSYANRISAVELVEALHEAEEQSWGRVLRSGLPGAGEGTLRYRLAGTEVRAKTGSLFNGVSTLSGWVRTRSERWARFSILGSHTPQAAEDRVVRTISRARLRVPRDINRSCPARP